MPCLRAVRPLPDVRGRGAAVGLTRSEAEQSSPPTMNSRVQASLVPRLSRAPARKESLVSDFLVVLSQHVRKQVSQSERLYETNHVTSRHGRNTDRFRDHGDYSRLQKFPFARARAAV